MSNYEKSGPGGVGKRYGALDLGGIVGVTCGTNGDFYLDFEFSAPEVAAVNGQEFKIPESYGVLREVAIEVEEAFAAGTVDVHYNGVTILAAPLALTSTGIIHGTVTGAPLTIDDTKKLTVVVASVTGSAGYAKSLIKLNRI